MSRQIIITAGEVQATADLNDSRTADALWNELPITASGNTWGDEIYFSIPIRMGEEDPQEVVSCGDIAYWPPGSAFCIFFGPTPASRGSEIRPASGVNIIGHIEGDPRVFKSVKAGQQVVISKA